MKRSHIAVTAIAAATTLVVSGCQGAADENTLRIGAVLSLTGKYAPSAKYVEEGYKYWAETVNENGGIDGKQVEVIIRDDKSDPATAANLARGLVDKDEVSFILGPYGSGSTDTMAAVLETSKVPMLGTIASDSAIWDRRALKWTFQAFPSSTYDHEAFLAVAEKQGYDRITIVNEEVGFSTAAAEWAKSEAEARGMTVQSLSYPSDLQDFGSIVSKMKSFDPQGVTMGGYYEPSISLTKEMAAQRFDVPLYHFIQSADGVTAEALGPNVNGIVGRSSWEPQLPTEGNEEFVAGYQEMFGREPSYHSAAAYAAGQVAQAAIEDGGGDAERIRDFLAGNKVETIGGTYEVNEKGQQVGMHYIGIQWQNGKKEIIWPEEDMTAEVIAPKANWA
ncbi:MAG TPA: amino acid ABC transporter substrate-binding protein [Actinophytocola sp.]|nr:amino acid ABC transporter substrate-binding protein [Actinophytocola sp.]